VGEGPSSGWGEKPSWSTKRSPSTSSTKEKGGKKGRGHNPSQRERKEKLPLFSMGPPISSSATKEVGAISSFLPHQRETPFCEPISRSFTQEKGKRGGFFLTGREGYLRRFTFSLGFLYRKKKKREGRGTSSICRGKKKRTGVRVNDVPVTLGKKEKKGLNFAHQKKRKILQEVGTRPDGAGRGHKKGKKKKKKRGDTSLWSHRLQQKGREGSGRAEGSGARSPWLSGEGKKVFHPFLDHNKERWYRKKKGSRRLPRGKQGGERKPPP